MRENTDTVEYRDAVRPVLLSLSRTLLAILNLFLGQGAVGQRAKPRSGGIKCGGIQRCRETGVFGLAKPSFGLVELVLV